MDVLRDDLSQKIHKVSVSRPSWASVAMIHCLRVAMQENRSLEANKKGTESLSSASSYVPGMNRAASYWSTKFSEGKEEQTADYSFISVHGPWYKQTNRVPFLRPCFTSLIGKNQQVSEKSEHYFQAAVDKDTEEGLGLHGEVKSDQHCL